MSGSTSLQSLVTDLATNPPLPVGASVALNSIIIHAKIGDPLGSGYATYPKLLFFSSVPLALHDRHGVDIEGFSQMLE